MKRVFFTTLIVLMGFGMSFAQCQADSFTKECIPQLADGFNFLKGYKIDGLGGNKKKVEYSYVFTKGTQYMINLCASEATDGIVISLYDSQRKRVASSLVDGQFARAIAFPCRSTGIYYISYSFEESQGYCGGSALGFKKS